jgi:F-type H+-transporting ATPase subunit b
MTIDWRTLGIQTVNVVILIWLLQHFFWRPVASMIEQRRVAVQQTLAQAQAARTEVAAASADIEQTRASFASERDAILKTAQEAADQVRAASLDEASKAAASVEAAARSALAKEQDAIDKAWATRSSLLAVDIAKRLVARLDAPTVRTAFLDCLTQEIRALPDTTKQALTRSDASLEAISAVPLDEPEQRRYQEKIGEALGVPAKISFTVDPTLIAGIELRGAHLLVSNSWRADLTQIMADIAHVDNV